MRKILENSFIIVTIARSKLNILDTIKTTNHDEFGSIEISASSAVAITSRSFQFKKIVIKVGGDRENWTHERIEDEATNILAKKYLLPA